MIQGEPFSEKQQFPPSSGLSILLHNFHRASPFVRSSISFHFFRQPRQQCPLVSSLTFYRASLDRPNVLSFV